MRTELKEGTRNYFEAQPVNICSGPPTVYLIFIHIFLFCIFLFHAFSLVSGFFLFFDIWKYSLVSPQEKKCMPFDEAENNLLK